MYFKLRFGDNVQVRYIDLAEPENQERFAELTALAGERDLAYPLVMVNGRVRLAGSAHYYHILPFVEEVLAVPQKPGF